MKKKWNEKAKRLIKSEIAKKGISYQELVELINDSGGNETIASVNNKINRGTFSLSFFLECMNAINSKQISIDLDKLGQRRLKAA